VSDIVLRGWSIVAHQRIAKRVRPLIMSATARSAYRRRLKGLEEASTSDWTSARPQRGVSPSGTSTHLSGPPGLYIRDGEGDGGLPVGAYPSVPRGGVVGGGKPFFKTGSTSAAVTGGLIERKEF